MNQYTRPSLDPLFYPADTELDTTGTSAVAWSAIWAGTAIAIAVTLVLLELGAGFGLSSVSVWPGTGPEPETFSVLAGIWLIVTQWLSSLAGGYIAGRMRTRWTSLHTDEVFFRDTAHGFATWAVATIIVTSVAVFATTLGASAAAAAATAADADVSRQAADTAREAAASFALFNAVAMIIGAFIASVAAAIGGRLRDKHP
jgi:hypothetical protein